MRRITSTILLTSLFFVSSGQNALSSFQQFDAAVRAGKMDAELEAKPISFSKNNQLNIAKSQNTLDSIVWILGRHPRAIISLTLRKKEVPLADRKADRSQSEQILSFLVKKGIDARRILSLVRYETQIIDTAAVRIRLISLDFSGQ